MVCPSQVLIVHAYSGKAVFWKMYTSAWPNQSANLYGALCSLCAEFSGSSKGGLYFHSKVWVLAIFLEALLKLYSLRTKWNGEKEKNYCNFKKKCFFSVLLSVCECRQVFAFSFWQKWQSPLSWMPAWYQPTPERPRETPPQHKAHLARKGAAAERHSQGRRAGDRLRGPRRRGRQHDESWCVRRVSLSLALSPWALPLFSLHSPPLPPFKKKKFEGCS